MGNRTSRCLGKVKNDHPSLYKATAVSDYKRFNKNNSVVLEVAGGELKVHSKNLKALVTSWKIKELQKYQLSTDKKSLVIRSGPQSSTGVGIFLFNCQRAEDVFFRIQQCWESLQNEESRKTNNFDSEILRLTNFLRHSRNSISASAALNTLIPPASFESYSRTLPRKPKTSTYQTVNNAPSTQYTFVHPGSKSNTLRKLSEPYSFNLLANFQSEPSIVSNEYYNEALTNVTPYTSVFGSLSSNTPKITEANTPFTPLLEPLKENSGENSAGYDKPREHKVTLQPAPKSKEEARQRWSMAKNSFQTTSFGSNREVKKFNFGVVANSRNVLKIWIQKLSLAS